MMFSFNILARGNFEDDMALHGCSRNHIKDELARLLLLWFKISVQPLLFQEIRIHWEYIFLVIY